MRKIILTLSFFLALLVFSPLAQASYAPLCVSYDQNGDCSDKPCSSADQAANPPKCSVGPCASAPDSPVCKDVANTTVKTNPVVKTIGTAAKVISILAGIVAVIIIIVSGISMIASGGNSESVATARKRLTGAVIGLAVASMAWVLSSYVLQILS